jgi:hypothetical protein
VLGQGFEPDRKSGLPGEAVIGALVGTGVPDSE